MGATEPTSVLIVEDDPVLRPRIVEIVGAEEDFIVVAACPGGEPALAVSEPFEMAIVDLGLPDLSGVELIRELALREPSIELMAHTVFEDRRTVFDAIVAGAGSYVLKGGGGAALLTALRELRAGGAPMSPRIARYVLEAFQQQGRVADRYTLSGRERQVLGCLDEGLTYKEVASALHVSRHTVHTHIKRIYEKLHAHSKAEALAKARMRGML